MDCSRLPFARSRQGGTSARFKLQSTGKEELSVSFYTLGTPYYEGTSTEHCPSQNVTTLVSFRTLEACQALSQSFQGLRL
jgi:hypothetical protein